MRPYLAANPGGDVQQDIIAAFGLAIEKHLGLRLIRKKVAAETTVVDAVRKAPVEN